MCEALLEFPEGYGGEVILEKNPFHGGGMDISGTTQCTSNASLNNIDLNASPAHTSGFLQ